MQSTKFDEESTLIRSVLEPEEILEINHLEENEKSMTIHLIVTPDEYIRAYVRPLSRIGYTFYENDSTIIKLAFQRGDTFKYNLYLSQAN
jgi:hypothetical protein